MRRHAEVDIDPTDIGHDNDGRDYTLYIEADPPVQTSASLDGRADPWDVRRAYVQKRGHSWPLVVARAVLDALVDQYWDQLLDQLVHPPADDEPWRWG